MPSFDQLLAAHGNELSIGPVVPKSIKKRKPFSEDSNETIAGIFQIPDPNILTPDTIENFLSHHPEIVTRTPYAMAVPKTLLGIEVEVENVLKIDPNIPLLFWVPKNDGSLRNRGIEFVTPGAINAASVEPAFRLLFDGLNPDVDFSLRTSIHIHLDVRQLTMKQALGLLLTYTALENLLFKFVGLNRRTNIFCVPITESGLLNFLTENPTRVLHSIDQYWSKYTALNLLPMVNLGTMEFRHMPGTKNLGHILTWIDLLCRLKRHAYRFSFENIIAQISELNSSSKYKQFVDLVFEEASIYLDCSNLLEDMEKPVFLVKNSMVSNEFHKSVITASAHVNSQLYNHMYGWQANLSAEQRDALQYLVQYFDFKDPERLFKDIVARPHVYLKGHPEVKERIVILLKPSLKKAKKSSENVKLKGLLDLGIINNAEYHQLILSQPGDQV